MMRRHSGIDDDGRVILRGSYQPGDLRLLRYPLDITKIFIDVWNPDSGTDVFVTYVVEALKHVSEQADLSLVSRSKIGVTAFGAVGDVTRSIPRQKGFAQAGARGDDTDRPFRGRLPGI